MVPVDLPTLVVITALSAAAPILADLLRRPAVPVVVVEIMLGILAGPHVLHLVRVTPLANLLAQFGLAFLFFLAGFELDPDRRPGGACKARHEHVGGVGVPRRS